MNDIEGNPTRIPRLSCRFRQYLVYISAESVEFRVVLADISTCLVEVNLLLGRLKLKLRSKPTSLHPLDPNGHSYCAMMNQMHTFATDALEQNRNATVYF